MDAFSVMMETPRYRWRFFNLLLAFMTYYLGFMGYKNDGLKVHLSKTNLAALAKKNSSDHIQVIGKDVLQKLEDEAIYLDSSLTLKQLATALNVTPENLSLAVNQKFAMGFRDLLNQYRVDHVKQLLNKNHQLSHSILDIALDSGFNSQASFYRAFKKFEGVTPKVYLDNQSNNV
jgi:AraC-like DNA-binding protein